ncbi:MAG: hypothetical protein JOZ96_21870 [Acidobacteria bacterium]|nr:hypothetical protein [Acidobacteriota bacterium]
MANGSSQGNPNQQQVEGATQDPNKTRVDLLKAIDLAAKKAADKNDASPEDVEKWLAVRKQFLDQKRREGVWISLMTFILIGGIIAALALWLLGYVKPPPPSASPQPQGVSQQPPSVTPSR